MFAEERIRIGIDAMLRGIDPPQVCFPEIARRAAAAPTEPRQARSLQKVALAAAAAVMVVASLPLVAPGFVQTAEQRIEEIIRWTPPPNPPRSFESRRYAGNVTLAQAQEQVPFSLVVPAGIPADAKLVRISLLPVDVYSNATHSWSNSSPAIGFTYLRANGKTFTLRADHYDEREGPPSKYTFEDMDVQRNGQEVIVRHDEFTWRNGEQVTSADNDGLSDAEIFAIQRAMNGIAVPETWPPARGTIVKRYRLSP